MAVRRASTSASSIRRKRPDFLHKPTNPEHPHVLRPPAEKDRPRWILHLQAHVWRNLMAIGMFLHRFAPPKPPPPAFHRTVRTTVSPIEGKFELYFFVPNDYKYQTKLRKKRYPVVVNFHGGGFTLGTATDDARWAQAVVNQVNAVVVSVAYRLAPEHRFPTPVEDGVDALKYLCENCEELLIDPDRMAISGFSSGGNMTFTVPLRMQSERIMVPARYDNYDSKTDLAQSDTSGTSESSLQPPTKPLTAAEDEQDFAPQPMVERKRNSVMVSRAKDLFMNSEEHELEIKALCAWYPPTDYTRSREERRKTCRRADQELPAMFTQLFDESYLQPPTLDMANPYLSPGKAPVAMLAKLPQDIIMYTCEWDMLLEEGEHMRDRLINDFGKDVRYHMVPGVPHAWDKAPNPLKVTPGVWEHYCRACRDLRDVLRKPKKTKPVGPKPIGRTSSMFSRR